MATQEGTSVYAAAPPVDGALDKLVLPCVSGSCMEVFLREVSA